MALQVAKNETILDIIKDGMDQMKDSECESFEYVIGEFNGKTLTLRLEPTDAVFFETIKIDGVNGFGYTLVYDDGK